MCIGTGMRNLIIFSCLLFLSSCVSVGTPSARNTDQLSHIKRGITTQSEVQAIYGDPQTIVTMRNGLTRWHYSHTEVDISGSTFIPIIGPFIGKTDSNSRTIHFDFDSNGRVKEYATSETTIHSEGLNIR